MPARYLAPTGLEEALTLMRDGPVSVVAGGTDFYPALGSRPVKKDLLDLGRIPGLKGIEVAEDGSIRIGAATTWSAIASADLPPAFAALRAAAREVGGIQIQNAGTIGGNLCNASPAADGIPPLLILDTEVELSSASGVRTLPLSAFLTGVRQTALREGELLTALRIPAQPDSCGAAFEKLGARRYLVISIAMTAALVTLDAQGRIDEARVAVGACSAVAQRLPGVEGRLAGRDPGDLLIEDGDLAPLSPITDFRADAAYRAEAATEQIRRAVHRAAQQAGAANG